MHKDHFESPGVSLRTPGPAPRALQLLGIADVEQRYRPAPRFIVRNVFEGRDGHLTTSLRWIRVASVPLPRSPRAGRGEAHGTSGRVSKYSAMRVIFPFSTSVMRANGNFIGVPSGADASK